MLGHHCTSEFKAPPRTKRSYLASSSFKMAIIFAVLLGLCAGILGYFHYYFNKGHYIKGADRLIQTEINHIVALWPLAGGPKVISNLLESSDNSMEKIYAVQDRKGNIFLGNAQKLPEHIIPLTEDLFAFNVTAEYSGQAQPGYYAAKIHRFDDGKRLMVALRVDEVTAQYRFMQKLSLLTIFLMFVVIIVSFALSTFVVSRTNQIANTAQNIIETGDLSRRMHIDSNWDDLSYLGGVLNMLLSRMENLVFSVRQISDNIAHDMRTPLTRLRTHLEDLLTDAQTSCNPKVAEKAEILLEDADHMLATFNALLRIGRLEASPENIEYSRSDLNALIHDVIELYEPYAEEKNITITYDGQPAIIECDHHLLFQAFANILDNALKFTPEGGTVTCLLQAADDRLHIVIADSGHGVSDENKKRIFNRFFRAEESRHSPGTGLGLALVAAIIHLHHGQITLTDNHPVLIVDVALPIHPPHAA